MGWGVGTPAGVRPQSHVHACIAFFVGGVEPARGCSLPPLCFRYIRYMRYRLGVVFESELGMRLGMTCFRHTHLSVDVPDPGGIW